MKEIKENTIKLKKRRYKDIAGRLFDEAQKSSLNGDNKLCALLLISSVMMKNKSLTPKRYEDTIRKPKNRDLE